MFSRLKKKNFGTFPQKQKISYASFLLKERKKVRPARAKSWPERFSLLFFWKKYRSNFFGIALGLAFFVVVAGIFFFSNFFDIRDIALTRKDMRVNIPGISRLLSSLQGENIFGVSEKEIQEVLRGHFPEIDTVTLEKDWPGRIEVTVATLPIIARWELRIIPKNTLARPSQSKNLKPTQKIYFLNSRGQISPVETGMETPPFLISEEVAEIPPDMITGKSVIAEERLREVLNAKDLLGTKIPYPIRSAQFFREAQEIHFVSVEGPEFWLDFQTPLGEQIKKIDAAQQEVRLFEKKLTYLDLRVPGRVIYKEE